MISAPDDASRESRTHSRVDAHLDALTQATVDELAARFHQPRAAVVCYILQWGLSQGSADTGDGGASEGHWQVN